MLIFLDLIALTLATIHFGVPIAYYTYLKRRQLNKPWNIKKDLNYTPKIVVIVPTYNEAELIEKKLNNIYQQDYPRDKMGVIVIDSASIDGTPEKVEEWIEKHKDMRLNLLKEPMRKGKAHALNTALKYVGEDVEIIVISDVDSAWRDANTLKKAISYFSDQIVGAVSCLKEPESSGPGRVEEGYRDYYNIVRLAESKVWATPIFHGELAAYRRNLLMEIGGFPTDIGADDSHTATRIALMGYRAITPDDVWSRELIPREKHYHRWRIRRAQHLIQHFAKILKVKHETPRIFKGILTMEEYLHMANPWILIPTVILLIYSAIEASILALTLLGLGIILLTYKTYRTWITTQLYLILATVKNLATKEIVWSKETK